MSGIWGTISFNNAVPEHVDNIMRTYYTKNCIIDRSNVIQQHNYYFGCGLQYITPEAPNELLPYYDTALNLCFTADCILDNRDELLQSLGEKDTTMPDGTLIRKAYYKWGITCVNHLRGLFSFVIYDLNKNTIYLVADQVASRCLYYYRDREQLTFSTLVTPLRSLHNTIKYNELYLKDFLTAPGLMPSIISNETPFHNVYKLNPGTYLEITKSKVNEIYYWSPDMQLQDCNCKTPKEYGTYFKELYDKCIKDALRTNGNLGIAMSSGLDSSSIGAIAAKYLHEDNKSLYAYTYIPHEPLQQDKNKNNVHNEEKDVNEIAKMHPNILTHFLCNEGKNCFEEIPNGARIMEIPYKAYGNLPSLLELYEKASSNSCKVVLSGQMGNSTVSYGYIDNILYDLYSQGKYLNFLKYLNRYSKIMKESRMQALKGCLNYFKYTKKQYATYKFNYKPDNPFLSESICDNYPLEDRLAKGGLNLSGGNLPISRQMYQKYLCMKSPYTYMGEMETKIGLAFGIILRDPTKDMRMLNFCYHLPYHLFAYRGTPRWLIRNHLQDILPSSLLHNWMRYGVQNSDCHTRLIRDWDTICPTIKKQFNSPIIQRFINTNSVADYFNRTESKLNNENDQETQYLMIINVLYSFYQHSY